jgi:selenide,water dikinase
VTGLNLVAYNCALGLETLREILRGGAEKMMEAGAVIVGGHSVDDPEPKYGLAVTGIVDPRLMITIDKAKPGDVLVLTKKIGTGIITSLRKAPGGLARWVRRLSRGDGRGNSIRDEVYEEAIRSMRALNQRAAEIMLEFGAHACTDITGFGLLGHAYNMAEASGVGIEISYQEVPRFEGIEAFAFPGTRGGGERNREWMREKVTLSRGLTERELAVLCDAQTSGPLFIALSPEKAPPMLEKMKKEGVLAPAIIGRVTEGPPGRITLLP